MLITDCVRGCSVLRLNLDRPEPVRELTQDGSKAGAFFVKAEPEGCFLLRQWQGRLRFSHSDPGRVKVATGSHPTDATSTSKEVVSRKQATYSPATLGPWPRPESTGSCIADRNGPPSFPKVRHGSNCTI